MQIRRRTIYGSQQARSSPMPLGGKQLFMQLENKRLPKAFTGGKGRGGERGWKAVLHTLQGLAVTAQI